MHRNLVLDQLNHYLATAEGKAQASVVREMIQFVKDHPRCFERDCMPGHMTGSAWVVDPAGEAVVLVHHKKLERWLQPGGHCDGEKNPSETAWREVIEETGLTDLEWQGGEVFDVDIHPIPAVMRGPEVLVPSHLHYDIRYVFHALGDLSLHCSHESNDLQWIKMDSVEEFTTEESVLRMRDKWSRAQ